MTVVLTRDQVRRLDQLASELVGLTGVVLMENAGRSLAEALLRYDPDLVAQLGRTPRPVVILCGKGNNAGDGLVLARHLEIFGAAAEVAYLVDPGSLAGAAAANRDVLAHTGVTCHDLSAVPPVALDEALDRIAPHAPWLVDALLGTGAAGDPREPLATAIRWMNRQPARRLAVDVPTGLDCDTGAAGEPTVRADFTCTMAALKPGLLAPAAQPYVGDLYVASIGVPPLLLASVAERL